MTPEIEQRGCGRDAEALLRLLRPAVRRQRLRHRVGQKRRVRGPVGLQRSERVQSRDLVHDLARVEPAGVDLDRGTHETVPVDGSREQAADALRFLAGDEDPERDRRRRAGPAQPCRSWSSRTDRFSPARGGAKAGRPPRRRSRSAREKGGRGAEVAEGARRPVRGAGAGVAGRRAKAAVRPNAAADQQFAKNSRSPFHPRHFARIVFGRDPVNGFTEPEMPASSRFSFPAAGAAAAGRPAGC